MPGETGATARRASVQKTKTPGREPPGESRFSTFFNVAAIGGKSPRLLRLCPYGTGAGCSCQSGFAVLGDAAENISRVAFVND